MTKVYRNLSSLPLLNNVIIMFLMIIIGVLEKEASTLIWIIVLELLISIILGLISSRMSIAFKKQVLEIKFLLVLTSFVVIGISFLMYDDIALYNKPFWLALTVLVLFLGFVINLGFAIHFLTLERLYYLNYPEVVTDYRIESKKVAKEALFFLPMCFLLIMFSFFMVMLAGGGVSV